MDKSIVILKNEMTDLGNHHPVEETRENAHIPSWTKRYADKSDRVVMALTTT